MTLDLSQVQPQIEAVASRLAEERLRYRQRAQEALALLRQRAPNWEELEQKRRDSRITWLAAGLEEPLDACYPLPGVSSDFTVLATDGSHIPVDRHAPARCYLINIGVARLHYGREPQALLSSQPILYSGEEDLTLVDAEGTGEEAVEGALLGAQRTVAEVSALVTWAESAPGPTLALMDGSLILWGLEAYPEWVQRRLLRDGFLPTLDRLKSLSVQGLALASYISLPRSTEVASLLRLALCPYEPANCDRHCPRPTPRPCQALAGLEDRYLFSQLLGPGERSASFTSCSNVVRTYYGQHPLRFCYLHTGDEVARVEYPAWADVSFIHTLVWQQVQRGQGYPVALSEAHEQAVVGVADRENFWRLVEDSLQKRRLPVIFSAKSQSKRQRWL